MIRLLTIAAVIAVVVAAVGTFSLYGLGGVPSAAWADSHPPEEEPPPEEPPPEEHYEEPPPEEPPPEPPEDPSPPPDDGGPPPDDGGPPPDDGAPPPDGGEPPPEGDFNKDEPPPDGQLTTDGPPPEGELTTDGPPPEGDFNPDEPPPDGEFFDEPPPEGDFNEPPPDDGFVPPPDGEFYHEPPEGEFKFEPPPEGFVGPDGDPGTEGTFFFDDSGNFVFEADTQFGPGPDGAEFGDPGFGPGTGEFDTGACCDPLGPDSGNSDFGPAPDPNDPGYFPDGDFHDFFDPDDFSDDLFVETFNPDSFGGDFGDFFREDDFQPGEFDTLFNPEEHNPADFGSYFTPEEFVPGEFGEFAAVGEDFRDFGNHFDAFWGERPDEAHAATEYFADINPEDFNLLPPEDLLGQVHQLDYQGFQELEKDVVFELFNDGLAGQEFDLQGDQWAGAFAQFDPEDIKAFEPEFLEGAMHDFDPEDFLGIPDDQAFALFESTFLAPPPGEPGTGPESGIGDPTFGIGPEGAPAPAFDPEAFAAKLDEFGGQLSGLMGAMGGEQYAQIDDRQMVDIFSRIDFQAPDFDREVLTGENLGGIFGSLDHESFQELGQEHIFESIEGLQANDFGQWDPEAAFNVFENIDFTQVVELENLDGLVGAFNPEHFDNVDDEHLIGMIGSFGFGGPDFDLATSALDGQDVAGLIGSLDGEHLGELGGDGVIEAIQHLSDGDFTLWEGGEAFDVFNTIGVEQALGLDQLEGIVGNFGAEHVEQLGENLGEILGALDFEAGAGVLGDFSFEALSSLSGDQVGALDPLHLIGLTNTTGGDNIIGLGAEQIETIVGNLEAGAFADFDPTVVGGMFAGMDGDQIGNFELETLGAALEAAGANLLGGLGDFNAISGGATSFDLLADATDLTDALAQDGSGQLQEGAVNFFSGSLFGGDAN